jgi:hypothetical protein
MPSKHGSIVRGLDSVPQSSVRDQRFGRMFRNLPAAEFGPAGDAALVALGQTMFQGEFDELIDKGEFVDRPLAPTEEDGVDPDENPTIPAGYTYFGQFVDHDITFDPVSSLDRFNDPDALQDFRTPRLDLDSVYGSGPDDQPFLYEEDGKHFLLGDDTDFDQARQDRPDLPRNSPRQTADGKQPPRRALVGDKRNDENLIVSQIQNLFLRFHNKVLDTVAGGDFAMAQTIVRWHYQWIVLHDFLKRIVGAETHDVVVGAPGRGPVLRYYEAKGRYAFIPVEFSVGAYRFGHSMVRPSYSLNRIVTGAIPSEQPFGVQPAGGPPRLAKFHRIPIFSLLDTEQEPLSNLNGFRALPGFWAIDWAFFFPNVLTDGAPPAGADIPQKSYRIDTELVDPLVNLPDHQNFPIPRRALAVLNLLRSWRLGLPSGQAVARRLSLPEIPEAEVYNHANADRAAARAAVLAGFPGVFDDNTPLWFYILREAEFFHQGEHLGAVGGTIIAEVLAGLIVEDRHSFLSQWPGWTPTLPSLVPNTFTMSDLINFVHAP